jgi:hypothetical protein
VLRLDAAEPPEVTSEPVAPLQAPPQ